MSKQLDPVVTEGSPHHNGDARLVAMANDIGNYFRPQSREEAIAGIASHIERFWTPRMRAKLSLFLVQGSTGDEPLDELPRAALERLNERERVKRTTE